MAHIYITPAGCTCTCGYTRHSITGTESMRFAHVHAIKHENDRKKLEITDYRFAKVLLKAVN